MIYFYTLKSVGDHDLVTIERGTIDFKNGKWTANGKSATRLLAELKSGELEHGLKGPLNKLNPKDAMVAMTELFDNGYFCATTKKADNAIGESEAISKYPELEESIGS